MNVGERVNRLIVSLLRDTLDGKVSWNEEEPPYYITQGTDDRVQMYCEASYGDVNVGVYEVRYKYYHDEYEYSWATDIRLVVLDKFSRNVMHEQRVYSPALGQLFSAAREQASGISDILGRMGF